MKGLLSHLTLNGKKLKRKKPIRSAISLLIFITFFAWIGMSDVISNFFFSGVVHSWYLIFWVFLFPLMVIVVLYAWVVYLFRISAEGISDEESELEELKISQEKIIVEELREVSIFRLRLKELGDRDDDYEYKITEAQIRLGELRIEKAKHVITKLSEALAAMSVENENIDRSEGRIAEIMKVVDPYLND
jgi:hypothetical protein